MTSDSRGNLLSLLDAKGNESHFEYDANGNLIRAINALGQVTAYEYDGEDRLVRLTDAKGNSSSLSYDAKGRMVALTDPLGNTRTLAYDKTRNLVAVQDAYGNRVIQSLSYDNRDNLLGMTDALGNSSGLEYDELNRLKQSTDPLGRVVQMNYDALDRLSSTVDPLGGIAAQSFDADGRLIDITDPKGNRTSFAYDSNGRRISETSATGSTVKYTYTARDLLAKLTNARGQERQFTYDALGRLIAMSDPDGTISYSYDVNSNVLTVSNADGTISREYDALDRVIKYTDSRGNVIRYEYDAVGNLSSLTYPDVKQFQYGYDAADRLVSVTDWNNRTTSYAYDKEGRLILTTRPNGSTVARVYNEAGQLLQQKDAKAGGEVIVQYDYTYDKVGNIVEEKPTPAPEPMAISPAVMTYGPATHMATYNGLPVQHDADGNMVQGPLNGKAVSFVFDSRNRLRQVGSTVYTYNAENQRIAAADGGASTQYIINPNASLSQVLIREDQAGKKTYYVYGIGLIGQEKNGAYRSFHYDFRGSTVAMTDETGKITHQYAYTAYGTVKAVQEEAFNPFRYVGQYGVMYEGNGLYYMRARYYQPELRRFLGEDPIWNKNLFAYVEGNPLVGIDPSGLYVYGPQLSRLGPGYNPGFHEDEYTRRLSSCGAASIVNMVRHITNNPNGANLGTEIQALTRLGATKMEGTSGRMYQISNFNQLESRLSYHGIQSDFRSFDAASLDQQAIAREMRGDLIRNRRLIINPRQNISTNSSAEHFFNVHKGVFFYNSNGSIDLDQSYLVSSDSWTASGRPNSTPRNLFLSQVIESMQSVSNMYEQNNTYYLSVRPQTFCPIAR
ncbi:hypothetical protein GMJAKD_13440 [Candidatus Electrothrix aarhusensis]